VCVIGETVRNKLFGAQDPIGSRIRLQKLSCEVVGLLEPKGQNTMGQDQDDVIVVPLRTFQRRIAGNDDVSMIQVSVKRRRFHGARAPGDRPPHAQPPPPVLQSG
jgi:putative ABC transport system permease protein